MKLIRNYKINKKAKRSIHQHLTTDVGKPFPRYKFIWCRKIVFQKFHFFEDRIEFLYDCFYNRMNNPFTEQRPASSANEQSARKYHIVITLLWYITNELQYSVPFYMWILLCLSFNNLQKCKYANYFPKSKENFPIKNIR